MGENRGKESKSEIVKKKKVLAGAHTILLERLHTDLSECVYMSVLSYSGIISAQLCTPLMRIWSHIEVISGCQRLQ